MATKWKNTSEKWKEINARNRDLIMVLGVGAMAGGLFFILMNVIYRGYYSDAASLIFSAIGNVSFGGGSILLVNNFLSRKCMDSCVSNRDLHIKVSQHNICRGIFGNSLFL